jgi:RNA-binding protein 5/10
VQAPAVAPAAALAIAPAATLAAAPSPGPSTPAAEDDTEFCDATGKICLLCARQFKTPEQTRRHTQESALHKVRSTPPALLAPLADARAPQKNLQDMALREVARGKARASRAPAAGGTDTEKEKEQEKARAAAQYRDRAAERRVMHNQPDVPMPESADGAGPRRFEGPPVPAPTPAPPAPPAPPARDAGNVGNKLLKMMGWKEGEGLGAEGQGIVDPMCVRASAGADVNVDVLTTRAARQPCSQRASVSALRRAMRSASTLRATRGT